MPATSALVRRRFSPFGVRSDRSHRLAHHGIGDLVDPRDQRRVFLLETLVGGFLEGGVFVLNAHPLGPRQFERPLHRGALGLRQIKLVLEVAHGLLMLRGQNLLGIDGEAEPSLQIPDAGPHRLDIVVAPSHLFKQIFARPHDLVKGNVEIVGAGGVRVAVAGKQGGALFENLAALLLVHERFARLRKIGALARQLFRAPRRKPLPVLGAARLRCETGFEISDLDPLLIDVGKCALHTRIQIRQRVLAPGQRLAGLNEGGLRFLELFDGRRQLGFRPREIRFETVDALSRLLALVFQLVDTQ